MSALSERVRACAVPLNGSSNDYDALLERVGDARFVLLGEASHGTHEFYRERAEITKRLIREKEFRAVAVEADWPDAYRINRFVRSASEEEDAIDALVGFERFPQWMWRNADVLDFVGWLRTYNDRNPVASTGFYGLDLYSLRSSIEAVLRYLAKIDPLSANRARKHYACFDHLGSDVQSYGLAAHTGIDSSCEEAVVRELTELRKREAEYVDRDRQAGPEEFFYAEQNAVVVKNAEQYYRSLFHGEVSSWNLRDQHMMDTLVSVVAHLEEAHQPTKVVVWAHNSHIGNAAATEMKRRGEFNLGQLVREHFGNQAVLIGFTTHTGTVTAASDWDAPAQRKRVRPSNPESYEFVFHETGIPGFWLDFAKHPRLATELQEPRLERAIGVIYRPETEMMSHYLRASLPEQFDAVLHFDETRAVEPLERMARAHPMEVEETFPSGL